MEWYDDEQEVRHVGNHLFPAPPFHPVGGPLMTKQADALESDINYIMMRYSNTGILPPVVREGQYGDFSVGMDYHEAMNRVCEAEEHFAALPAAVRDACDNDPGQFLDMCLDEENREKLEKLGLLKEMVPEVVQKVEVVKNAGAADPKPDPKPTS